MTRLANISLLTGMCLFFLSSGCSSIPEGDIACPSGYPFPSCPEGYTCIQQEPGCEAAVATDIESCASQDYSVCSGSTAYWYDSCGNLQGVREECTDTECFDGQCLEPKCDDTDQNGSETDVDCGGSCPTCEEGQGCLVDSDCSSYLCTESICAASSCSDGVANGGETDVDCGGPGCTGCAINFNCLENSDCESTTCQNGKCVMSFCNDNELNGTESDIDCGGADCTGCEGGQACGANEDCLSQTCSDGACTEFNCPSDMVRIGERAACIDKYEATVYANADCTGTRYGANSDDYPAGFPNLTASDDCTGDCQGNTVTAPTTTLYGCSVNGVIPSAYITWYQARRACENSGKQLCTSSAQWQYACESGNGNIFPYGDSWVQGECNDGFEDNVSTVATGSYPDCHGQGFAASIFDMSGNLWEWLESGVNNLLFQGGGSEGDVVHLQCNEALLVSPDRDDDVTGFRCCYTP